MTYKQVIQVKEQTTPILNVAVSWSVFGSCLAVLRSGGHVVLGRPSDGTDVTHADLWRNGNETNFKLQCLSLTGFYRLDDKPAQYLLWPLIFARLQPIYEGLDDVVMSSTSTLKPVASVENDFWTELMQIPSTPATNEETGWIDRQPCAYLTART